MAYIYRFFSSILQKAYFLPWLFHWGVMYSVKGGLPLITRCWNLSQGHLLC